ncbi:MAG: zinc-ribbon domain-containing protein [Solirubrobacteraceae bacterium]
MCAIARRAESNRRVRYQRSLAAKHPDLAAQLHPTLNPGLDPCTLEAGSGRKVWWHCPECGLRLADRPRKPRPGSRLPRLWPSPHSSCRPRAPTPRRA